MRLWWRLLRMGRLLLAQDTLLPPQFFTHRHWMMRLAIRTLTIGAYREDATQAGQLAEHIARLGPSYIKLGQLLATRPDMIGQALAEALSHLQDRLPAFSQQQAQMILDSHCPVAGDIRLGKAIAAASIAQVHRARYKGKRVAVKLLRANIFATLEQELRLFHKLAAWMMRWHKDMRRLRPDAAVDILRESIRQECDLRLEAAALSEMAANTKADAGFMVPEVMWEATSSQVLVTSWEDGIRIDALAALQKQKLDLPALGDRLIDAFLTHALRDGFFHADMHPGNILVKADGHIIALDFGIMGRLDNQTRYFLAKILHGFIHRDYAALARVHFHAGYVPPHQDEIRFSQALRAIGEPLHAQPDASISMAKLLEQLFATTHQFDMPTQPQLLLLQKTMLVVEGIARQLNPQLNIWTAAQPAVQNWLKQTFSPSGVGRLVKDQRDQLQWILHNAPALLEKASTKLAQWLDDNESDKPVAAPATSPPPVPDKTRQLAARWVALLILLLFMGWGFFLMR